MGLKVTEFNGHPTLPAACGMAEHWNGILDSQLRGLLTLCAWPFLGAGPSVRQSGYLTWLSQEGFIPFGNFWLMARPKGVEIYVDLF